MSNKPFVDSILTVMIEKQYSIKKFPVWRIVSFSSVISMTLRIQVNIENTTHRRSTSGIIISH